MPKKKFRPKMYVTIYQLARQGLSLTGIAGGIGVDKRTLRSWIESRPAVKDAIERGRDGSLVRGTGETFIDYVYNRLPPKLQKIWDKLSQWELEDNGSKKIEALLAQQGKRTRQHLFIHSMVASNFNPSEACRRAGISRETYEKWAADDPPFAKMLDELAWHRKNFVEGSLMDLVGRRSEAATIYANRTVNRDRGYDPKSQVEISGGLMNGHLDMNAVLDRLSVEAKREVLGAIRTLNKQAVGDKTPTVTVTRVVTNVGVEGHDSPD